MKQNTARIKDYLQQTYTGAQARIIEFAGKAQNSIEKAQSSIKSSPARSKERLDELVAQLSVRELLELLKRNDVVEQSLNLRSDLYGQLGLVSAAEFANIQNDLTRLTTKVDKLAGDLGHVKGQLTTLKKKLTTTTSVAKKATPPKATAKKASATKKPTKKTSRK